MVLGPVTGRQKSALDEFLLAGVSAIASKGIDRISVSQVTQIAKSTRPTFYTYFGDIQGLFAEIWIKYGKSWLENLASENYTKFSQDPFDRTLTIALSEILAISHRAQAVQEVVVPTFAQWHDGNSQLDAFQKSKLYFSLANKLGVALTMPIAPGIVAALEIERLLKMVSGPTNTTIVSADAREIQLVTPEPADKTIESRILKSTMEVIADSGVVQASMARIARRASFSTGSLYPRFENSSEVLNFTFEYAQAKVLHENFSAFSNKMSSQDFGRIINASLKPSRKIWRDFRIEIHVDARVNSKLSKLLAGSITETTRRISANLEALAIPNHALDAISNLSHSEGLGLGLLLNVGLPVDEMDFRPLTMTLVEVLDNFVSVDSVANRL
jgi:AcrR family transcriptional regulator